METHTIHGEQCRTIFFTGKPGSGKGTQAKLLSEATGWPIRVASDGLREIIAGGGVVGRKLKETMDAGFLTPSWFPGYLFIKWLSALPADGSVIFDGFNRKISEAEFVSDALKWIDRPFIVVDINVSDASIRERLKLRKEVEGRTDDAAVDKRFEEYYANTAPVKEFFRKAGVLIEIDGEPTPEEIAVEIREALGIK